ncbi:hypothetical protein EAI_12821 [Harpegnathos saltator]|uniref:Uncharacterized protein n=1 Tax=Harpegnathos saltator TaxID=610380 RepID=E2BXD4_HARSA|nr:hypothetical protein EAI_12821 [Harpegnathos saltator]
MEDKVKLTLKNAENGQLYNIFVSPEEAKRLETDESNSSIVDTELEHFDEN